MPHSFMDPFYRVLKERIHIDGLVKSLFTRHCEEQSDKAIPGPDLVYLEK